MAPLKYKILYNILYYTLRERETRKGDEKEKAIIISVFRRGGQNHISYIILSDKSPRAK